VTELPAALQARVPTLTEVVELPDLPDLADPPYRADERLASAATTARTGGQAADFLWTSQPPAFLRQKPPQPGRDVMPHDELLEAVLADITPAMQALVSSRLRDVLAPAVQEAVEEAVERLRQPLIDAVQAQLREQLEQSLRVNLLQPQVPANSEKGHG